MKKCPYCSKEIQDEAIKCRYCNETLNQEEQQTITKEMYTPQSPLSFNEAIATCFRKYFDFSGRARGSEYWYFYLFIFLLGIVGTILDVSLFGSTSDDYGPLYTIATLGTIIPLISAATRRLHDSGKSGWWQLLYLTVIGIFVVLYWLIRKGDDNENEYTQN